MGSKPASSRCAATVSARTLLRPGVVHSSAAASPAGQQQTKQTGREICRAEEAAVGVAERSVPPPGPDDRPRPDQSSWSVTFSLRPLTTAEAGCLLGERCI